MTTMNEIQEMPNYLIIWQDCYGRFLDALDAMRVTKHEHRYVLGYDKPHFPLPVVVDKRHE